MAATLRSQDSLAPPPCTRGRTRRKRYSSPLSAGPAAMSEPDCRCRPQGHWPGRSARERPLGPKSQPSGRTHPCRESRSARLGSAPFCERPPIVKSPPFFPPACRNASKTRPGNRLNPLAGARPAKILSNSRWKSYSNRINWLRQLEKYLFVNFYRLFRINSHEVFVSGALSWPGWSCGAL